MVPKLGQRLGDMGWGADGTHGVPSRGKELAIAALTKAAIDEEDRAAVGCGADDAAGGLQHAVHARINVGVRKAGDLALVEIVAD